MTELEKSEKWINENWKDIKKGVKVRVHHDYTSEVVDIVMDGKEPIVVYKDWNKYRKYWDYHCSSANSFMYNVALYVKMYNGKFGAGKVKKEYA